MKIRRKVFLGVCFVLILNFTVSCMIGGKIKNNHLANHPSGENVKLILNNEQEIGGEFLGIDSEFLFLLFQEKGNSHIMKVSWNHLKTVRITQSSWRITDPIIYDQLLDMALRSRYPQGISDTLLADLLTAYGQDEVKVL